MKLFFALIVIAILLVKLDFSFEQDNNFEYFFTDSLDNGSTNYNVIIIVIDALRPDHLPCYGYWRNTSPNICKFGSSVTNVPPNGSSPPMFSIITLLPNGTFEKSKTMS